MKRFTQFVCLILILSMVLVYPAMAAEVTPRASNYFMSYSCYLWKTSSTKFEVWFDVTALRTMDELGASVIKVQRSTDKSDWETVKTYYASDYSQMLDEDSHTHAACVTYSSYSSSYYYRAKVELYAKDSSGSATYTVYTSIL